MLSWHWTSSIDPTSSSPRLGWVKVDNHPKMCGWNSLPALRLALCFALDSRV